MSSSGEQDAIQDVQDLLMGRPLDEETARNRAAFMELARSRPEIADDLPVEALCWPASVEDGLREVGIDRLGRLAMLDDRDLINILHEVVPLLNPLSMEPRTVEGVVRSLRNQIQVFYVGSEPEWLDRHDAAVS